MHALVDAGYMRAVSDPETHYRDTHVVLGDPLTLHARQSGTMRSLVRSLAIIIDTRLGHRRHRQHHHRRRRRFASSPLCHHL